MIRMFDSSALPALEQTAIFAQARHEVLAGNLANLDTPDYRAVDLPVDRFQEALAESIERAKRPSPGHHRSPGMMTAASAGEPLGPLAESMSPAERDDFASGPRSAMEPIVRHDGSDVSIERQVADIAKNQALHNLAIATMRSQFATLRAAITERA